MVNVTVYQYRDAENVPAPLMGTWQAIERVAGKIEGINRQVAESDLKDGFYPKPGVWRVRVLGHIYASHGEGPAKTVPRDIDYEMHEASEGLYSLSALEKVLFTFQLSRQDVDLHLLGKMERIAGVWPPPDA